MPRDIKPSDIASNGWLTRSDLTEAGLKLQALHGTLVAAVDVPLQLFQFKRALRMTRQELRDEAKESDGRPETKQRIRQIQQAVARRRMMR